MSVIYNPVKSQPGGGIPEQFNSLFKSVNLTVKVNPNDGTNYQAYVSTAPVSPAGSPKLTLLSDFVSNVAQAPFNANPLTASVSFETFCVANVLLTAQLQTQHLTEVLRANPGLKNNADLLVKIADFQQSLDQALQKGLTLCEGMGASWTKPAK